MGISEAKQLQKLEGTGQALKTIRALTTKPKDSRVRILVTEQVRLTLGHQPNSRKFPCTQVHCRILHNPHPSGSSPLGISSDPRNPKV